MLTTSCGIHCHVLLTKGTLKHRHTGHHHCHTEGRGSWALAEPDVPSGPALAPSFGSVLVWLLWGQWARRFQDGLGVSAADT